MTDRFKGFIVTLSDDVREDDAQAIVRALGMIKGVVDVRPVLLLTLRGACDDPRPDKSDWIRVWKCVARRFPKAMRWCS